MKTSTAAISCLLAVALFVGGSEALNCWSCDSATSSNCNEYGFQASSATSLGSCTSCQKTVSSASLLGVSTTIVTRSCVLSCTAGSGGLSGLASTTTYCCSDKDNCNTASTARLALTTAGALVALTFVVRRLY